MGPKLRRRLKPTEPLKQDISSDNNRKSQELNSICEEWISTLNEELTPDLDNKFNELMIILKKNIELKSKINENMKNTVNEISGEVGISADSVEECETALKAAKSEANSDWRSVNAVLTQTKSVKSKTTLKLKKLSNSLDKLKDENKVLMNAFTEDQEIRTLANIMKVKYRVNSSGGSVCFDFEDRKRNQPLISSESEHISQQFWAFLEKKYGL